jgi:hypothetical protein
MTLSSHDTLREVDRRQQEAHQLTTQAFQSYQNTHAYLEQRISNIDASLADMRVEQYRDMAAIQESVVRSIQPLLNQTEKMVMTLQQSSHPHHLARGRSYALPGSTASGLSVPTLQVSATISSSQCPRGCKCRCHTRSSLRTPSLLRGMLGQLQWSYKSSISLKSCNHPMCRKSVSNQHFTYYFPRWLVSRAFVASANLDNIFGAGAKVMINIPLIVPEEEHIVWSLVIAGNVEELQRLLARDKNLMYVRNQWGQSIMHVSWSI